ncbi:hypothetical protein LSAT2_026905 [Lamellibrachia satsuma]|nr:hypothetical protein LSAT2_026905 [Lamellibrachia satsuma]
MAATAENLNQSRRMNLSTLKQRDPFITAIVDTASQVALYSFSSKANEWEKTDIEGTLFVYSSYAVFQNKCHRYDAPDMFNTQFRVAPHLCLNLHVIKLARCQ